jgi:nitrate/nitrite transporter NarK
MLSGINSGVHKLRQGDLPMKSAEEMNDSKTHSDDEGEEICPYFGKEEGCDVGMPHSTAHDVELMVSLCSSKFERCSRHRMYAERNACVGDGTGAPRLFQPSSTASNGAKEVAWGVLQHELRTPLTAIITAADILKRKPDRELEVQQRFVGVISDESERMKNTVEALFKGLESIAEPVEEATEKTTDKRVKDTLETTSAPGEGRQPRREKMSQKGISRGWSVVLAGTGINLALGILYTWSIFKSAIHDSIVAGGPGAFDWDLASINDPYALCCLVFAVAMIAAGRMQDKLGPRLTAMAGGLLVGIGFTLMSLSNSYMVWVMGFGVLAGTGIGFGYSAATPAALKWFPPKRTGLIAGIVVSGFGLASVYIAPLAKYLLSSYGLQQSMLIFGVAFAVVVAALSMFLVNPPSEEVSAGDIKKSPQTAKLGEKTPSQILRTPGFYALWLTFFVGSGAGLMVIGSVAGMAKASLGEMAFIAVAAMAVGNAAGRIVAGVLSDKIGRGLTLTIMMVFQAALMFAAVPILRNYSANAALLVSLASFIGFNYGTNLALFPAFAKDRWGLKNLGTNYGILFSAWGVGGLVMGRVSEMLKASTGNYETSFLAASALLIAGSGLALSLAESRKPILRLIKGRKGEEQVQEPKEKVA